MHDIYDLELRLSSDQKHLAFFDDLRFLISNFNKSALRAAKIDNIKRKFRSYHLPECPQCYIWDNYLIPLDRIQKQDKLIRHFPRNSKSFFINKFAVNSRNRNVTWWQDNVRGFYLYWFLGSTVDNLCCFLSPDDNILRNSILFRFHHSCSCDNVNITVIRVVLVCLHDGDPHERLLRII